MKQVANLTKKAKKEIALSMIYNSIMCIISKM